MFILTTTIVMLLINIIAIIVIRKKVNLGEDDFYEFLPYTSIIFIFFAVILLISISIQSLFQPYGMKDAFFESVFIGLFGIAFLGSVCSLVIIFFKKARLYFFQWQIFKPIYAKRGLLSLSYLLF